MGSEFFKKGVTISFYFMIWGLMLPYFTGAQNLDTSFHPDIKGYGIDNGIVTSERQSDGKILIGGNFTYIKGVKRTALARFHQDGTLDETFNVSISSNSSRGDVRSIALQADGKIIIAGSFTNVNNENSKSIVRLNPDGSTDRTFNLTIDHRWGYSKVLVQNDGKILATDLLLQNGVIRLNNDGTLDESFTADAKGTINIVQNNDNSIFVLGNFNSIEGEERRGIAKLDATGKLDKTFNPSEIPFGGLSKRVLMKHLDGKVIVSVYYMEVVGGENIEKDKLVRLNKNGTIDNTFSLNFLWSTITSNLWTSSVVLDPNGKLLVAGYFKGAGQTPITSLIRLNTDGSLDNTFSVGAGTSNFVYTILALPDGKYFIAGDFYTFNGHRRDHVAVLQHNGSLSEEHVPVEGNLSNITSLAIQPDDKILLGGIFLNAEGNAWANLARLRANGELDEGFSPIVNGKIDAICLQPDGKILIAGIFNSVNGRATKNIARLLPEGSLDESFSASVEGGFGLSSFNQYVQDRIINQILMQEDGKILICGQFYTVNDEDIKDITRLNSDGSIDKTFTPPTYVKSATASSPMVTLLQPDGKILVFGRDASLAGFNNKRIIRLHQNGTLDETFDSNVNHYIQHAVLQESGEIVILGSFSAVDGVAIRRFARLKQDGSLDRSFTPPVFGFANVTGAIGQHGGKVLAAGVFNSSSSDSRTVIRLNQDGSLDDSYRIDYSDISNRITALHELTNGDLLLGRSNLDFAGAIDDGEFSPLVKYKPATTVNGIEDGVISDTNLDVYPNPASSILKIKIASSQERMLSISLYNLIGDKVLQQNERTASQLAEVNVEGFARGVYIAEVVTSKGIVRRRVVLQ